MKLETRKLLYDMLQAARDIERYTDGLDLESYRADGMTQAAVERKFEIVGEALNRLSHSGSAVVQKISDYPRIIGFRNVIAHGYDVVDVEIVWEAVQDYLPALIREVDELLNA